MNLKQNVYSALIIMNSHILLLVKILFFFTSLKFNVWWWLESMWVTLNRPNNQVAQTNHLQRERVPNFKCSSHLFHLATTSLSWELMISILPSRTKWNLSSNYLFCNLYSFKSWIETIAVPKVFKKAVKWMWWQLQLPKILLFLQKWNISILD